MRALAKKILCRCALFLAASAVAVAGMNIAARRNRQNAPDAVPASAAGDPPVIVLDAGHGEST